MLTLPARLAAGSRSPSLPTVPGACPGSLAAVGAGLSLNLGAMTTPTYRIRPAVPDDMLPVLRLISSSAAWLQESKHTDQWARPWPNRDERDARVGQGIKDGLTWMVEDSEGVLIGTVTCRGHGNDMLWTPAELAEPAAYVSRLIVSRDRAGQGIGAALIHWAGARAVDQWGADWVRVDVWTTNTALHQYYKGQGFEHLRTLQFKDYWEYPSAALFQKPAAEIDKKSAAKFELTKEERIAGGAPLPVP
jgi:ribosomal protein S18 acetylase RimI-like enzyme